MTAHEGFTLLELSKLINAKLIGDGEAIVDNLSTIQNSNKTSLTFLSNKKYWMFSIYCFSIVLIINYLN